MTPPAAAFRLQSLLTEKQGGVLLGRPTPLLGPPTLLLGPPTLLLGPPTPLLGPPTLLLGLPTPLPGPPTPLLGLPTPLLGLPTPCCSNLPSSHLQVLVYTCASSLHTNTSSKGPQCLPQEDNANKRQRPCRRGLEWSDEEVIMCLNLSHKNWKRITQRITNRGRRVNAEHMGPQARQHFNSFAFPPLDLG